VLLALRTEVPADHASRYAFVAAAAKTQIAADRLAAGPVGTGSSAVIVRGV
jgi:hypothetical protein